MKKLIALAAALVATAVLHADDKPPELRLPETTKPVRLEVFAKASDAVDWDKQLMGFPAAWKTTQGEGVVAYVYDTGINKRHPEFAPVADRIEEVDFTGEGAGDEQGHGSHCSSTIFGQREVNGGARKLKKLVMLKVLKRDGSGDFAMMEKAIRWAIADMKRHGLPSVHSASLGTRPDPNTPPGKFDERLYAAFKDSIQAGAVWCVAAGNDGPAAATVGFPARYGEELPIIVVAACNRQRLISTFSSRGKAVYVTAPGEEIVGAGTGSEYLSWAGTSMATPGIGGGIACYLSVAGKSIPPGERQQKSAEWLRTVCSFPNERNVARGYGLPDFGKVADLKPSPTPTPPPGDKVFTLDLVRLRAEGYTSIRMIGVGGPFTDPPTPSGQPVPVAAPDPVASFPAYIHPPGTVPTWTGPSAAPAWSPPPVVYHPMPACPPQGCQPAPLFPALRQWVRR